jgi:hypothetical protein
MHVWVDDSGGKGQEPVTVFLGLAQTAERWAEFSDRWVECRNKPPVIRGKIRPDELPESRLREFARIINAIAPVSIRGVFENAAINQIPTDAPKPFNQPYFWLYHAIIWSSVQEMFYQRKTQERFAITFDEHVILGPRAVLWYPFLKSLFPPEEQAIMPIQPMSESDDRWMPLQAADLFAWCTRRAYAAGSGFEYNWILEDMPDVQLSHHSQTINVARWEKIVRDAADVVLSPELERLRRELFDG